MERDVEDIIERVNRLMAIANDPAASDNESDMAYERAQRLINRYRLEDWERDHTEEELVERWVKAAHDTLRHSQWKLAQAIAKANGCRTYASAHRQRGRITAFHIVFVDMKSDVDAAVLLYEGMEFNCANRYRAAYRNAIDEQAAFLEAEWDRTAAEAREEAHGDIPRRRFRDGFHVGFSERIGERFDTLTRDMTATGTGRDLVLTRAKRLDDYFDRLNAKPARAPRYTLDGEAVKRGYEEGGMVGLGLDETEADPGRRALGA